MNNQSKEDIDCLSKLPLIINNTEEYTVPKLPPSLFHFEFNKKLESKVIFTPHQSKLVLADSPLVKATLVSARKLTPGDYVKNTLELTFKFEDEVIDYVPGDSFGFLCPNNSEEVDLLLNRLNLQNVADIPTNLIIDGDTGRKIPDNIPPLFTLRQIFLHCVEIRAVPKKILFRILSLYTVNETEKQSLLFLSSSEGSNYFTDLIRKQNLSILDILSHYPSCKPPVEKIIECLPPLRPRFYSVASSPFVDKSTFRIVFNVVKMKSDNDRLLDREGVCTGWLQHLASNMLTDITNQLSSLKLDNNPRTVFIYKRKNLLFNFPERLKQPIIMVGPGTGIAPFIGYLQHREMIMERNPEECKIGQTWLFFGCRYKDKDFLYKTELERLVEAKVLNKLIVSFSRDTQDAVAPAPRYVHENIKMHAQELADCIKSGKILVCGDAKNMAPNVQQAFIQALQIGSGVNESQAKSVIESMQKEHRYVNDVWA